MKRAPFALVACLALAPAPCYAQTAARVVDLINRHDSATAEGFLREHLGARALHDRTLDEYVTMLLEVYRQSGGVTVRSTEPFGSGEALTLWARNADRGIMLAVAPDRDDPARIGRLDVMRWFHPAATVRPLPAATPWNAFRDRLHAELDRLTRAGEFAGTVAIARNDSIVFEEGFGESNGPQTLFHLASVGKMFTAVAIGQLVNDGRLSFDDSLAALLPRFPWADASRAITVRHLLGHTSGLGQSEHAGDPIDSAFAATPPAFPPGSRFSYSNDGYEVLGLIIERVSSRPYWDYIHDRVLVPAGMTATAAYAAEQPLPYRAIGYGHRDGDYFGAEALVPNTDKVKGRGTAAGGSYGTARDLLRFGDALASGRLLPPAMVDTLVAGRLPLPGPHPDERYGYGFESHVGGGLRIIGHAGGGLGWGICARLDVLLERHYSVAVLSNVDPPVCEDVSRAIASSLIMRNIGTSKHPAEPPVR